MSKKQGVKKGSQQANDYTGRLLIAQEKRDADMRRFGRIYELDMVTLALGRMGWREKKFKEFDEKLLEVAKDYCEAVIEDYANDKDAWYYKESIDREIKQYVGSLFVPYDERYQEGTS